MNVQLKLRQCFKNGTPDSEITEIIQNSIPKQIKNLQLITSSIILGISTFATIITIIFIFAVTKAIKNQKVSRKYYIFILNRSVGDFFTSFLFVILSILRLILHNPTQIQKTVLQIIWYIINASLWSEMISYHLLSGIKLYAVAKPIHYRQKFKTKYCIYLASLSWIIFLILLLVNSIIYVIRINNKEYYHTNIFLDIGGTIHGKIQDIISTTIYLITLIFFILTVILVFRAQKFQNKSRKKPNFPFSRFAITFTVFILFYSLLIFADIYFSFIYPKTSFCFQIHSQVTAITVTEIIWILGLIRISIDPIINCFTDKEIMASVKSLFCINTSIITRILK